ncbi:hypothetical protein DEA98_10210 [Brucella pseudogrignonensis]|nr:hypothetical protein [Brucella pseudogrignonensis]
MQFNHFPIKGSTRAIERSYHGVYNLNAHINIHLAAANAEYVAVLFCEKSQTVSACLRKSSRNSFSLTMRLVMVIILYGCQERE